MKTARLLMLFGLLLVIVGPVSAAFFQMQHQAHAEDETPASSGSDLCEGPMGTAVVGAVVGYGVCVVGVTLLVVGLSVQTIAHGRLQGTRTADAK